MTEVGAEIRQLRRARGWTGAQLAVYAGMAPSAISQIETGRRSPNAGSLEKIANALRVEVVDLFPKEQAPLPEMQEYGALLEEKGFPRVQIAAWLAQEERDKEFIAHELEKMSEQDFREALIAASPKLRMYYRENQPRTDAPPRSKSA